MYVKWDVIGRPAMGTEGVVAMEAMPTMYVCRPEELPQTKDHVSKTIAIKDNIFDIGTSKHVMLFIKLHKNIINYIHQKGSKEPIIIATALANRIPLVIPVPLFLPQVEDPNQHGQSPPIMIDNPSEIFIWQETMKTIIERRINLEEGILPSFALHWDQC